MTADTGPQRPCRTCRQSQPESEFYEGCTECKVCKRGRSKRNRALQARKLAAFERLLDVLVLVDNPNKPVNDTAREGAA